MVYRLFGLISRRQHREAERHRRTDGWNRSSASGSDIVAVASLTAAAELALSSAFFFSFVESHPSHPRHTICLSIPYSCWRSFFLLLTCFSQLPSPVSRCQKIRSPPHKRTLISLATYMLEPSPHLAAPPVTGPFVQLPRSTRAVS